MVLVGNIHVYALMVGTGESGEERGYKVLDISSYNNEVDDRYDITFRVNFEQNEHLTDFIKHAADIQLQTSCEEVNLFGYKVVMKNVIINSETGETNQEETNVPLYHYKLR